MPVGTGGTVTATGGQVATGGASGVAGARATGGTPGAAGSTAGSSGSSGSLPPVYVSYTFDQTAGPALMDASGNGRGGALEGGASFGTGVVGNDLKLDGTAGTYVRLPAGLVSTLLNTTIAFWVRPRANASSTTAWQRVFDFGADTSKYMFFTSSSTSDANVRAASSGSPSAGSAPNRGSTRLDRCQAPPGPTSPSFWDRARRFSI